MHTIRTISIAALAALICCCAGAQPAADSPVFEAMSVKPPPDGVGQNSYWMKGGPGSLDPTRIDWRTSLNNLFFIAYKLEPYQLSAPDWVQREKYDIVAKVPPGATLEQFRMMVANLLTERFKLQFHREKKEALVYSLTVAKGGPKLQPHTDAPPAAAGSPPAGGDRQMNTDAEGFPVVAGKSGKAGAGSRIRSKWNNVTVAELLSSLAFEVHSPVTDSTGLTGKYDIDLHWISQNYRVNGQQQEIVDGPDIFAALRDQLGLNLTKSKGQVEILVVDHIDEVPTAN